MHTDAALGLVTASRWQARFCCPVICVLPGQYAIADGNSMIATLLGSCVAVCLRDGRLGVGGMNHFLLPSATGKHSSIRNWTQTHDQPATRYGDGAMQHLINAILKAGGRRKWLEAKIFGGARLIRGPGGDIGANNLAFARAYLQTDGIPLLAEDVGGRRARRLYYRPATGEALVQKIGAIDIDALILHEQDLFDTLQDREPDGPAILFDD